MMHTRNVLPHCYCVNNMKMNAIKLVNKMTSIE